MSNFEITETHEFKFGNGFIKKQNQVKNGKVVPGWYLYVDEILVKVFDQVDQAQSALLAVMTWNLILDNKKQLDLSNDGFTWNPESRTFDKGNVKVSCGFNIPYWKIAHGGPSPCEGTFYLADKQKMLAYVDELNKI